MTWTENKWFVRMKVLLISGLLVSIGNYISSAKAGAPVMPWEALPALGVMLVIIVGGCLLQEFCQRRFRLQLPGILYISALSVLVSIPGLSPIAGWVVGQFDKINLLSLCTPILAYAGIAIGKDLDAFKRQGVAIICVALLTFLGTYIGSAVIAQVTLMATGVI